MLLLLEGGAAVLSVRLAAAERVVTDMLGRSIRLPEGPLRLVSLAPSLTETVFALSRGEWVVGVSEACDYPPAARTRSVVGSIAAPNLERIVGLRPDLVLGSAEANTRDTLGQLARLKLPVYGVRSEGLEGILAATRGLGSALQAEAAADGLVREIRRRAAEVRERVSARARPRVLYLIWTDPPIAAGPATFIHDLLEAAGGANVVQERSARYLPLGWEEIVARGPEVILVATHQGGESGRLPGPGNRAVWAGWQSIPAVRSGRVVAVPADTILRPGPRVGEGMERLARAIHPEAFPAGRMP
jgi:iron complex transport system substrate-binding protein